LKRFLCFASTPCWLKRSTNLQKDIILIGLVDIYSRMQIVKYALKKSEIVFGLKQRYNKNLEEKNRKLLRV
jgi:hypothetical protein